METRSFKHAGDDTEMATVLSHGEKSLLLH